MEDVIDESESVLIALGVVAMVLSIPFAEIRIVFRDPPELSVELSHSCVRQQIRRIFSGVGDPHRKPRHVRFGAQLFH